MWSSLKAVFLATLIAFCSLAPTAAGAETVAMIGTGNVGAALGRRFAENGHKVIYGSRDPSAADVRELVAATGHGAVAVSQAEAAAQADIVVLAVPWTAVESIVRSLPSLSGKIVVDLTGLEEAIRYHDRHPSPDFHPILTRRPELTVPDSQTAYSGRPR